MSRHYILRHKQIIPCDMWTWAQWFEKRDGERIVGFWKFRSCNVSTVFLGLDHRFVGEGPPILFETMVFGGPKDGDGERYSTYDEAEQGHLHYCETVREMERAMNWRKAKKYRNRLEHRDRQWNNTKVRRRRLAEMTATIDELNSRLNSRS